MESLKREEIAVIGMSCKFPGSENVEEYWDLMVNGKDAIRKVPEGRWEKCEPEYKDTFGGFLKSAVDEFDANFFGISPREA
jgi:acyl transferase domain-containing protein